MRVVFCESLRMFGVADPGFVFFTGDLGFSALEPLRESLGTRFINAGVAEQNMVSVAAGMAQEGWHPWIYSIAPFLYARPFEQIRNDVCFHKLPVVMVGNGGGYGYGVMGATHHAIEDYGTLANLPNMTIHIPAFDEDLATLIPQLLRSSGPTYLRLGLSEKPSGRTIPELAPWRKLLSGTSGDVVVVVGPLVGGIWNALLRLTEQVRPDLWVVTTLPFGDISEEFLDSMRDARRLIVVEEHVEQGGAGQRLAARLLQCGRIPARFESRHAKGYPSGTYGSQKFHRRESGLDPESILKTLVEYGHE